MLRIRLVPANTAIPFMRFRRLTMALSAVLLCVSIFLFLTFGLNYGIDFRGGIMIEAKLPGTVTLSTVRNALSGISLGDSYRRRGYAGGRFTLELLFGYCCMCGGFCDWK